MRPSAEAKLEVIHFLLIASHYFTVKFYAVFLKTFLTKWCNIENNVSVLLVI